MVEAVSLFPFPKLRNFTFITLDVLLYIERNEAFRFMFAMNKEARAFLKNNFTVVRNGFINEGLITYKIETSFNKKGEKPPFYHYRKLKKLYFDALDKQISNRKISIALSI